MGGKNQRYICKSNVKWISIAVFSVLRQFILTAYFHFINKSKSRIFRPCLISSMPVRPPSSSHRQNFSGKHFIVFFTMLLLGYGVKGQNVSATDSSFADTTGGYHFMYLTTNCFECSPKGLVYYKKFVIISGVYKVRDFYSAGSSLSADHFKEKYTAAGYFKDKVTQLWKSPQLFNSLADVKEYKNDLVAKLKSEGYMVVVFDENIKPGGK
jgi:hypothetical protein